MVDSRTENASPGYVAEDGSIPTTDLDFFLLKQTPSARTQNTENDFALPEQFSLKQNNFTDSPETSEENSKREILTEEETDDKKEPRPELCRMRDQSFSIFGDHDYIKTDYRTDEIQAPSDVAFNCEIVTTSTSEFSNYEESNPKDQNLIPSKEQHQVETEQEQPTFLECEDSISVHVEVHDGKDMYVCCLCPIICDDFDYLLFHIKRDHARPHYCSLCKMSYSEITSHAPGGKCDMCLKSFSCKYQFQEHCYSDHKDLYE